MSEQKQDVGKLATEGVAAIGTMILATDMVNRAAENCGPVGRILVKLGGIFAEGSLAMGSAEMAGKVYDAISGFISGLSGNKP